MSLLPSLFYPSFQWIQRHTVRRDYLREMKHQQRLWNSDLKTLQEFSFYRAVEYVNRMAAQSAGFQKHLQNAGVKLPIVATEESWRQIPFMTKAQIRDNPEAWYTQPTDNPTLFWSTTSGSSGQPFKCPIDASSMTAEIIANELYLKEVGWKPHMKEGILKVRLKPPTGFRRFARGLMGNIPVTFASRELNPARVPEVVKELRETGVKYLRGYPSALLLLAEGIISHSLKCPIPLIVALGEQLSPAGAAIIEQAFEGKVYRDYAASEAMRIGFECREQNGYHIDLTRYHLELLNEGQPVPPGETGEIVLTAFRNDAMPLVRYCIGDLATKFDPEERCPCGSPFPRLGEVLGRVVQVLHTEKGQQITEFFFHSFVLVINQAHEHVSRYKVLQQDRNTYEVLWVPRHARAVEHLGELERRIVEKAQVPLRITWREVEDIPPDPSGKRSQFVPMK